MHALHEQCIATHNHTVCELHGHKQRIESSPLIMITQQQLWPGQSELPSRTVHKRSYRHAKRGACIVEGSGRGGEGMKQWSGWKGRGGENGRRRKGAE